MHLLSALLSSSALAASTTSTISSGTSSASWLRIIQINDVYELDCFPHLHTLIRECRTQQNDSNGRHPDQTIAVCAGDFVAPSLLSSLDQGASMVDCLNAVGITHVCLGNHEADISTAALQQRMAQSNFAWINSNLRELDKAAAGENMQTLEYAEITVRTKSNTSNSKRVALLGLLTNDPSLYRPGAFGGAKIEPVVETAQRLTQRLLMSNEANNSPSSIDLIVPLTHQSLQEDIDFCKALNCCFPIVCGGHDHEPYDETVTCSMTVGNDDTSSSSSSSSRIIKTGMDAQNAAVIDIQWRKKDDTKPEISVQLLRTLDFAPHPDMVQRVQAHQTILRELERARLFCLRDWMDQQQHPNQEQQQQHVFSTLNNRLGPSTGTTALCTMLRMGMRAQCAIINAGAVRANKVYDDEEYFMWSDLKTEMPFSTGMTACYIPGKILEATIANSRAGARRDPPAASGGYLHCCSNIHFNDATDRIEFIQGAPFRPEQSYLTALPAQFFNGIDNHKPLLDWAASQQQQNNDSSLKYNNEESSVPAKMVVVQVFSSLLWLQMGSFDEIDRDQDGVLKRDEVKEQVRNIYGHDTVADLVVDSIFEVADMNGNGTITPLECAIVQFCATDLIDHVCTSEELKTMKDVASKVLGKDPSHDQVKALVERLRDKIDLAGDGLIHRDEVLATVPELKRTDLLH